jgi:hypothetical protein
MNTDQKIVTQVAAKIAADLVPIIKPKDTEAILVAFNELFDGILNKMNEVINIDEVVGVAPSGGRSINIIKSQDEIKSDLMTMTAGSGVTESMVQSSRPIKKADSKVAIKGASNGDVPVWLTRAASKAGVSEVFDNRDSATVENRRPHFVSTDASKKGFWPPKLDAQSSLTNSIIHGSAPAEF